MKLPILGATKRIIDKDVKEIAAAEFISVTIALFAGIFLVKLINKFYLIPALIILIPGFLAMHGSIFGSFAARLTVDLYTKKIKKKFQFSNIIFQNILATIFLLFVISIFLGVISYTATSIFFEVTSIKIILISLISAMLAAIIELPLIIVGIFWAFNKGFDPDDIMGPYVTVLGDIIGVLSLIFVIFLVA